MPRDLSLLDELHARVSRVGSAFTRVHRRAVDWEDDRGTPRAAVDGFCFSVEGVRGAIHSVAGEPAQLALVVFADPSGWVNHPFVVDRMAPFALVCGATDRARLRALGLRRWVDRWIMPCPITATGALDVIEQAAARDWRVLEPADLPVGIAFPRYPNDLERLLAYDAIVQRDLRGDDGLVVMEIDGERVEVTLDAAGAVVRSGSVRFVHPRGRFDEPFVRWCVQSGTSLASMRRLERPGAR